MIAAPMQLGSKGFSPLATVALVVGGGAAFFWHPLALLLFACLVAVIIPTNDFKWLFLVAACLLFTILNVSKQLDGDLTIYVSLQDYIAAEPFYTLFDKEELELVSHTYRVTEMGFYLPLWVIGQIIKDSKNAIEIYATLGIYVPTFLALVLIGRSENWSRGLILTIALFTFFAGINFVSSTHLIRQYMSASLLFYSFALFLSKRTRWAVLVALYAGVVHNGTGLLVPFVGIAWWLFRYREGKKWGFAGFFVRAVCMLVIFTLTMVFVPILQGVTLQENIPNIRPGHFVAVGMFFVIANGAILMQHVRLNKLLHYVRIAFIAIYALSLGFFALRLPLYALRYFAYLEWLYGLMLGAMMFGLFRNHSGLRVFSRLTVSLAAAAILIARIGTSEWMYGPGDNYFLSWNFFQVSQLVSR